MAGRNVSDKILAVVFPIAAFVAAGFEHCVANMYFIPLGIFLREHVTPTSLLSLDALDWLGFARNLIPVTLGNVVGGAGMVGFVYWVLNPTSPSRVWSALKTCDALLCEDSCSHRKKDKGLDKI
jgi:formate/nitrite transporter FocA (FNT family)